MRRVAVLVIIAALAAIPTGVCAQGFFDGTILGPYLGTGGTSSCDDVKPAPPCVFYVGYEGDPGSSTRFAASAEGEGLVLGGERELDASYAVRGVWVGASKAAAFSDRADLIGSFWYLFPDKSVEARETYVFPGPQRGNRQSLPTNAERTWLTTTQWWYGDLLGAFGSLNGFSALAGFRYDYFTTRFRNPVGVTGIQSNNTDQADVRVNGYIPLVGGQVASAGSYGALVFRIVGFPYLLGRVVHEETIVSSRRLEGSGTFKGNYFLEVFSEYAFSVNGRADLGIFGRFNTTHGISDLAIDRFENGAFVESGAFQLGLTRNSWTVGGRMNLRF